MAGHDSEGADIDREHADQLQQALFDPASAVLEGAPCQVVLVAQEGTAHTARDAKVVNATSLMPLLSSIERKICREQIFAPAPKG